MVQKIKADRILEDMFNGPSISLNTNVDLERANHIHNVAEEYFKNKIGVIVPLNVTDINVLLDVVKKMYLKLEEEKNNAVNVANMKTLEIQQSAKGQPKRDSLRKVYSQNYQFLLITNTKIIVSFSAISTPKTRFKSKCRWKS